MTAPEHRGDPELLTATIERCDASLGAVLSTDPGATHALEVVRLVRANLGLLRDVALRYSG